MSKRHQSSRRKAYGRRQHELRERLERHHLPEHAEGAWDEIERRPGDRLALLDVPATRLHLAVGD